MDRDPLLNLKRRIEVACRLTAPRTMLSDLRVRFNRLGLQEAVRRHDTPALYDWLSQILSYQGTSDTVAWAYMDRYGTVTFADVADALAAGPSCPKLRSHWHFEDCRYAKAAFSCSEPHCLEQCPLPQHDLRNGRLNQTAYSLFLFLRDVCDGDVVGWIDARLGSAASRDGVAGSAAMRQSILEPFNAIYGVSSKVSSMALADLLLAGDPAREHWVGTGASMIVVDSLVHNWLARTGSLDELGADHPYGPGCYQHGGCASIIETVSQTIDAREFCSEGPSIFPRLLQKALWLFCTESGLDMCNGNRIDDRRGCHQAHCAIFANCRRRPVRSDK